jgi:hypothetical protein
LSTGLLISTSGTGTLSTAVAGTDYVAPGSVIANTVATNETTDNATYYPLIVEASGAPGNESAQYATALNYNPSTGVLTAPSFNASGSGSQSYWSYYGVPTWSGTTVVAYTTASVGAVGITSYSSGSVTIGVTGNYLITGTLSLSFVAGGNAIIYIYVNGVSTGIFNECYNYGMTTVVTAILYLTAGSTVEIYLTHGSANGWYNGSFTGNLIH